MSKPIVNKAMFSICALWSLTVGCVFAWGCIHEGGVPSLSTCGTYDRAVRIWGIYTLAASLPWLVCLAMILIRACTTAFRAYLVWTILVIAYLLLALIDDSIHHFIVKLPLGVVLLALPWACHFVVRRFSVGKTA